MEKIIKASVCMAAFNGEKYIQQQIKSILSELQETDELIIVNDASTDNTVEKINEIKDSRIIIIENPHNLGIIKSFERAIASSNGDYIFLSDQDDIWLKGKVDICLKELRTNLMVVTDCVIVDENLNELHPSFFKLYRSRPGIVKNLWKNTYLGCCTAFQKQLIKKASPIPESVPMHDMWLGLVAQYYGSVSFIKHPLSLYRRHASASSPAAKKSNYGIIQKIKFRVALIILLIFRVTYLRIHGD